MRLTLRLATALLALGACAPLDAAAPPPRILYERALAREEKVRPDLAAARPSPAAIAAARTVIASYQRIVRLYPGSGYSDNALWQAARLAADIWAHTGAEADHGLAVRLLRALARGYPSSSLVARAEPEIKRLEAARSTPGERIIPVPEPAALAARDVKPPAAPPVATPPADGSTERATIRGIRRVVLPETVRVTIELDREVSYRDERIGGPDRVFVDLRGARPAAAIRNSQRFADGPVRVIRVGQRPGDTTRVVLEVDGITRHSVFELYEPYRLVIDCERPVAPGGAVATSGVPGSPDGRLAAAAVADDKATAPAHTTGAPPEPVPPLPARATAPRAAGSVRRAGTVEPGPVAPDAEPLLSGGRAGVPAPPPSGPPAANLAGRFSLSRQLGLGISRIVIDPGHGGHDPGARVRELTEADLVLDIALRLEQLLVTQPGVEVVLTRRTDVFIPLEERTAIANREEADLFLSIHGNASRNLKARGIETYFLNFASNPDAQAVAARENAASGRTMHHLPDIVKAIALNDKLDESRDFATMVQRAMIARLRKTNGQVRDLGVKQAPFVVLIGAGMPSVLAEVSFLTNPQEARLLKSQGYRQRIAEALFQGIANYQRALKNVRTVAAQ